MSGLEGSLAAVKRRRLLAGGGVWARWSVGMLREGILLVIHGAGGEVVRSL